MEQHFNFRTGLRELDLFLMSIHKPCAIAIASRPQEGKTSMALTIAENGTKNYNNNVLFFSGKFSRTELDKMWLSARAQEQITQSFLHVEEVYDQNFEKIVQKIEQYKDHLDAIVMDDIPVDRKTYYRLNDIAYNMGILILFTCSKIQKCMKIGWEIHRNYLDSHRNEDKYSATITLRNRRFNVEKPLFFIPEYLSFYDYPSSVGMDNF